MSSIRFLLKFLWQLYLYVQLWLYRSGSVTKINSAYTLPTQLIFGMVKDGDNIYYCIKHLVCGSGGYIVCDQQHFLTNNVSLTNNVFGEQRTVFANNIVIRLLYPMPTLYRFWKTLCQSKRMRGQHKWLPLCFKFTLYSLGFIKNIFWNFLNLIFFLNPEHR